MRLTKASSDDDTGSRWFRGQIIINIDPECPFFQAVYYI